MTGRDREEMAELGVGTQAIHAGEYPDPVTGASAPNLVMSTTFVVDPAVSFSAEDINDETPYVYTRWGNPTIAQLERKLAVLENAEECVAFASGVAAATAVLLGLLGSGDHVMMSDITYAAVSEFANDTLPRLGVAVTRVDTSDPRNVAEALRPETRLVYLESPANPLIRLTDIEEVARIAHAAEVKVAVDSTFATPIAMKPIELGADYVVHSLTKYFCGHGDAIAGAVLGRSKDLSALRSVAIHTGGVVSPFNAWLVLRGAATLPVRMRAHEQGALAVAQWLEAHPKVSRVIYPGLPSHPQYELAVRQLRNSSGMLTFQVENGPATARTLHERLRIIHYAVSLGHHRSLIYYLPTDDLLRSSFHLTPEQERGYRTFAGDGIFRLSVGMEDAADIISDLEQALAAV
jgi:methionine-gamma-lyase